jgi:hypothetical protein
MPNKINNLFFLLIIAHCIHATEEYFGKLWDVYRPAIFICNLISSDPKTGFYIINTAFIVVSLLFWKFALQKRSPAAYSFIWLWISLQTVNVLGHLAWTIYSKTYRPGVISSLLISVIVILLIKELSMHSSKSNLA